MAKMKKRIVTGVVIREKRRKGNVAKCARCGEQMHGVPRLNASEMKKLAKTEKRPERAYGGYYCSACTRQLFKEKARKIV
jgi:large subunit ribosomal protein L34e